MPPLNGSETRYSRKARHARKEDIGPELNQLLNTLAARHQLGPEFNVIKFPTDELKLLFLCYPEFLDDAHPALRHAVTIDLVSGRVRHTDYAGNPDPPIRHRKEQFLPPDNPLRADFAALTGCRSDCADCSGHSGGPLFHASKVFVVNYLGWQLDRYLTDA